MSTTDLFLRFAESSRQNDVSAREYFGLIEAMYVAAAIEHPEWGFAVANLIKGQMADIDAYYLAVEGIVSDLAIEQEATR